MPRLDLANFPWAGGPDASYIIFGVSRDKNHQDFEGFCGKFGKRTRKLGSMAVCFTPAKYDFPKCVFPIRTNWKKSCLRVMRLRTCEKTSGNYSAIFQTPQHFGSQNIYLSFCFLILETWETISSPTWMGLRDTTSTISTMGFSMWVKISQNSPCPVRQGLVSVPFWVYWTSPEKVAIIDHIPFMVG